MAQKAPSMALVRYLLSQNPSLDEAKDIVTPQDIVNALEIFDYWLSQVSFGTRSFAAHPSPLMPTLLESLRHPLASKAVALCRVNHLKVFLKTFLALQNASQIVQPSTENADLDRKLQKLCDEKAKHLLPIFDVLSISSMQQVLGSKSVFVINHIIAPLAILHDEPDIIEHLYRHHHPRESILRRDLKHAAYLGRNRVLEALWRIEYQKTTGLAGAWGSPVHVFLQEHENRYVPDMMDEAPISNIDNVSILSFAALGANAETLRLIVEHYLSSETEETRRDALQDSLWFAVYFGNLEATRFFVDTMGANVMPNHVKMARIFGLRSM